MPRQVGIKRNPDFTGQEGIKKLASTVDEQILRATKEIIVKFIEVGRISPTSFGDSFKDVYKAIDETVKASVIQEKIEKNE